MDALEWRTVGGTRCDGGERSLRFCNAGFDCVAEIVAFASLLMQELLRLMRHILILCGC